jgi:hypothetical protein
MLHNKFEAKSAVNRNSSENRFVAARPSFPENGLLSRKFFPRMLIIPIGTYIAVPIKISCPAFIIKLFCESAPVLSGRFGKRGSMKKAWLRCFSVFLSLFVLLAGIPAFSPQTAAFAAVAYDSEGGSPTFSSDTNNDFTVKGVYRIRLTSLNGKIPDPSFSALGVFNIQPFGKSGSDYYFLLIAAGNPGDRADLVVNGTKLLTATVGTNFLSDTNNDFTVRGTYQIRITCPNGKIPNLIFGTPGVFTSRLVKTSGCDLYFQITSVGADGAQSGLYINGTKLLVATAGASFKSDTTDDFSISGAYQIKLTSLNGKAPNPVFGTSGAFSYRLIKTSGSDYFFKITAVGAPGAQSGLYVNGTRLLTATVGK